MSYSAESHRPEQSPKNFLNDPKLQDICVQYIGSDPGYELDLGVSWGVVVCKKNPEKLAELVKLARACARSPQVGDDEKILKLCAVRKSLNTHRPRFVEIKRPKYMENPKDWVSVRQLLEEAGINIDSPCKVESALNEPNQAPVALDQEKLPGLG